MATCRVLCSHAAHATYQAGGWLFAVTQWTEAQDHHQGGKHCNVGRGHSLSFLLLPLDIWAGRRGWWPILFNQILVHFVCLVMHSWHPLHDVVALTTLKLHPWTKHRSKAWQITHRVLAFARYLPDLAHVTYYHLTGWLIIGRALSDRCCLNSVLFTNITPVLSSFLCCSTRNFRLAKMRFSSHPRR